jgi:hypothetical protein
VGIHRKWENRLGERWVYSKMWGIPRPSHQDGALEPNSIASDLVTVMSPYAQLPMEYRWSCILEIVSLKMPSKSYPNTASISHERQINSSEVAVPFINSSDSSLHRYNTQLLSHMVIHVMKSAYAQHSSSFAG